MANSFLRRYFIMVPMVLIVIIIGNLFYTKLLNDTSYFLFVVSQSLKKIMGNFDTSYYISLREREEYEKIKKQYYDLKSYVAALHYLEENIQFLRRKTPNGNTYRRPSLLAKVLYARKNTQHEEVVFVNRGRRDGINDRSVAVDGVAVIGKVLIAFERFSVVLPINHRESKIAVQFGTTEVKGIIVGSGNATILQAMYVHDPEKKVKKGMPVYTSGDGLIYPPGFFIGEVREAYHDDQWYTTVFIDWVVDFKNLTSCHLLLDETGNSISYFHVVEMHDFLKKYLGNPATGVPPEVA